MSRSFFRNSKIHSTKIYPNSKSFSTNLESNPKKFLTKTKLILIIGILSNLALLGYFKYSDFFIKNFNSLFDADAPLLNLALPLAISFFTFQQITYLCDSYHGKTAHYSLLDYSLFISFFPQLIAGPIVHHKEMMPQFLSTKNRALDASNIAKGIYIFIIGLFKKVVLADTFAMWANAGFSDGSLAGVASLSFIEAWLTSLSYTFQLYFDFSGYCDMALGAALLFNIRLPFNFLQPYKSRNIQDFWRGWHITLSRFLKDYIYIPLGGSRCSNLHMYLNLMATFLIGGLWHGASWLFVFWGGLHGGALVLHRIWQGATSGTKIVMPKILAWFITFNFVNFAWVFFRATDLEHALRVLEGMSGVNGSGFSAHAFSIHVFNPIFDAHLIYVAFDAVLALILVLFCRSSITLMQGFHAGSKVAISSVLMLVISLVYMNHVSEFLYFNF